MSLTTELKRWRVDYDLRNGESLEYRADYVWATSARIVVRRLDMAGMPWRHVERLEIQEVRVRSTGRLS